MNRTPSTSPATAKLHGDEVAKHNTDHDCWVVIHGKAYDVTEFKEDHPGGKNIILKWAGKDATQTYDPVHPPDTLDKYLDRSKHVGDVDMATMAHQEPEEDPEEEERRKRIKAMPVLEQCWNLMDCEAVAKTVMTKTAWAYYSSGADDEIVRPRRRTVRDNADPGGALDAEGKPCRLSKDLVSAQGVGRCGESRHLDHDAGDQGRRSLLRLRDRLGEAGTPRGGAGTDEGREEAQRGSNDPHLSKLLL